MQSSWYQICFLVALTTQCVRASEPIPVWRYEIVTTTGMPHIEENLRYTVTRKVRCLTDQDLPTAFSGLHYPTLAGCSLRQESREAKRISYVLVCDGGNGTTGAATWWLGERVLRGTLDVKLGGKNMTFFQRVTATVVGECSSSKNQPPTE